MTGHSAFVSRSHRLQPSDTDQQDGPDISLLNLLLRSQWDKCKNGADLGNILIKPHSRRKVWWTCDQCPDGHAHEWEARVDSRTDGTGCPFCASISVCQHNFLPTNAPLIAAQWSSKNQLSSDKFTVNSGKQAIWHCHCGHEWTTAIKSRTGGKTGCPECHRVKQAGRTLQRHPVLAEGQPEVMQLWDWEANGLAGLDPGQLRCFSNKKANWICYKCPKGQPHSWQAHIGDVMRGSRCPCCAGQHACSCNSLQALHPTVAAEWDHTRNEGTPDDYPAHSSKEVWWYNSRRGHFKSEINVRTRSKRTTKQAQH